ncbi:MFS transporter [Jatrophihabitans telluris]|uniref:MFS transporter n=1 Tax=Jatrophihabitans telluris TaxID=2038343 RepID=A0ABY4R375_9ACTN|nr:MFS transporter [Jatrophihabitans telluris]UQX90160.1 MFS transporter [Jatrophihabitans telluris]
MTGSELHAGHRVGSAGFNRLQLAMAGAALAAFALLYCTQPLLPEIGHDLGASPALASLSVSATTGALALAILPLSSLAESFGRVRLMQAGLASACGLVLLSALSPNLGVLLLLRALTGVALAAVVAVAMGHVGDEVHPSSLGSAMGVYVAGNTLGGVGGRLLAAAAGDAGGWRVGIVAVGILGLAASALFSLRVPPPVRFSPVPLRWRNLTAGLRSHLADPGIVRLCVVAFLLMGGFVAVYNYLSFRLSAAPFGLSQGVIGLFFLAYLAGTVSSTAAGRVADRIGPRRAILLSITIMACGLALTLPTSVPFVVSGLVVFTAGFFGAHAVASGWVARRASTARAQASALYLLAYYAGSSVLGAMTGLAYSAGGWTATAGVVGCCLILGGALAASVK